MSYPFLTGRFFSGELVIPLTTWSQICTFLKDSSSILYFASSEYFLWSSNFVILVFASTEFILGLYFPKSGAFVLFLKINWCSSLEVTVKLDYKYFLFISRRFSWTSFVVILAFLPYWALSILLIFWFSLNFDSAISCWILIISACIEFFLSSIFYSLRIYALVSPA